MELGADVGVKQRKGMYICIYLSKGGLKEGSTFWFKQLSWIVSPWDPVQRWGGGAEGLIHLEEETRSSATLGELLL